MLKTDRSEIAVIALKKGNLIGARKSVYGGKFDNADKSVDEVERMSREDQLDYKEYRLSLRLLPIYEEEAIAGRWDEYPDELLKTCLEEALDEAVEKEARRGKGIIGRLKGLFNT